MVVKESPMAKDISSPMDLDIDKTPDANNGSCKLVPIPVGPFTSGTGLPYAPENWPNPGDTWGWRVRGRTSKDNHFSDRYLFPPERFGKFFEGDRPGLGSKLAAEKFIKKEFPNMDLNSFFSSFIWRIPCGNGKSSENNTSNKTKTGIPIPITFPNLELDTIPDGHCKARNKNCSLHKNPEPKSEYFPCDICCIELGFCRECCCILCGTTVDPVRAEHAFFRCVSCGHGAHIKCAHRCYVAGVVGGSIGLDAEYYCRRCDNKIDLVPYLMGFLRVLEETENIGEVERALTLGLRVLSGAKRETAKILCDHMDSALVKIKSGIPLGEILKEDILAAITTAEESNSIQAKDSESTLKPCKRKVAFDFNEDIINKKQLRYDKKLDNEIQQALEEFKKSQEEEYRIIEEKLVAQKDHVVNLYKILELDRSDLADPIVRQFNDGETYNALVKKVVNRLDEVKIEEEKLRSMVKNCDGFMEKSKDIMSVYFDGELS